MTAPSLAGFPPIVGDGARTLILGNMPSAMSLAAGQYYANPRNAFWRIMADVFGFDVHEPYEQRVARLVEQRVAVWDVLRSCRRVGSLDAAIERNSMVANDFAVFFRRHHDVDTLFFNGAAAEKNFARLAMVDHAPRAHRLPSTSPANTIPYLRKLAAWTAIASGEAGSKDSSRIRQEANTNLSTSNFTPLRRHHERRAR